MVEAREEQINASLISELATCPPRIANSDGHPLLGTYRGSIAEVRLEELKGPYRLPLVLRPFKHKRWQYGMLATDELLAVFLIADLSYTSNAFAAAVDLKSREVLFDSSFMGLPGPMAKVGDHPGDGAFARFWTPGARLSFARKPGEDRYQFSADIHRGLAGRKKVSWQGEMRVKEAGPPLTAIVPVPGDGVVNVTQKWAGLPVSGALTIDDRKISMDRGLGGLDYSHGYLARHTAWRWGFALGHLADGTAVGLNLVEGFNDAIDDVSENALWVGRDLIPLGRARFAFEKEEPLHKWKVTTVDGAVDLTFRPIHAHREERNYRVVRSHFVQPLGTFEGAIKFQGKSLPLRTLAGVVEDQDVLW